ncbi:TonB-dependent receptor [Arenibacter algicola]|uniref:SusC/RagA family TonB-linked outer membrane protein n=1 Tax=Arenibacter algicola TaxID=616991 RepID=UPI001C06C43C|nr:TonB-dependent receptor [Arenibacter algicola]MBU2903608.1 TonB-dependent receptor [Arenibacter algicola]
MRTFIFLCCPTVFALTSNHLVSQPSKEVKELQNVVSGTITDENNQPLPGASVMVKGTSIGVITDFDGNFEINLPDPANILVISYIGYITQELNINQQTEISVSLQEDVAQLSEVVVVAFGEQKRENLTGAVSTISVEDVESRPVVNLANALQGAAPGLNITQTNGQPGSTNLGIQIRGASSANGAVDPLVIIDGVTNPIDALQRLNPDDVASISILKDAAAASIYGARAAGGVIIITTKIGVSGKLTFSYNGQTAIQQPLNLPDRLTLLEEAEYSNLARSNAGVGLEYSEFDLENIRNGVEIVVDPISQRYKTYNQQSIKDQVLEKQYILQSHNFSVSGGSEKTRHLFSLGFLDQDGFFKVGPDGYRRWNLRSNISRQLNKNFSLDSRISYSNELIESASATINGYGIIEEIYQARLRFPIFLPDGRLYGGAGGSGNNSYAYLTEGGYANDSKGSLDGAFTLTAKDLIKDVEFKAIYGRQEGRRNYDRFKRTVELYDNGDDPLYYLNNPNSFYVLARNTVTENVQLLADWTPNIGDKHNLKILGGYQWEDYRAEDLVATATNLISNDLPSLNFGDVNSLSNSQSIQTFANQSLLGRINYSFKDKYLFEASIRSDESSRLAPRSRIKWFPSLSVGWNMSRENWFSDSFVSQLKPRFSWGKLGNSNADIIGNYDYINVLAYNSNFVIGANEDRETYFYQNGLPSSSLSWETIETSNFGIDFGFLQNRIFGSFDYYIKRNKNMLIPTVLPDIIGIQTPRVNEGELKSWGWELDLKYREVLDNNFSFSIGFNLSDNQNELISYGGNSNLIGGGTNSLIEGYQLNTIWGFKTVPGYIETEAQLDLAPYLSPNTGIGDIEYVDMDGNGLINIGGGTKEDHGDLVNLGSTQQRYLYGITGGVNWSNIDFSFFFQGVGKRNILPDRYLTQPLIYSWIQPMSIHADYWTPENPNAAFPRPYIGGHQNFATSDRWVLNAAYLRLKNVQVGYSFSDKLVKSIGLTKLRLYVSGENLLTFSKLGAFKGVIDPEQRNGVHADYPFNSTLALGLNINF